MTVDTLRADHLSALGYDRPTTPFLDELWSAGSAFPHALATVPRTTQSLASLLTGAYPHTTRVRNLFGRLPEDVVSVVELLRAADWRTGAVVSNHLLTPQRGLDREFEHYDFGGDGRAAPDTTNAALRWAAARATDEKIFLWVHYIDPHVPYQPALKYAREFSPDYQGPYRYRFGELRGGIGNLAYPADLPKRVAVFRNPLSERINEHIARLYAADVRSVDDQIRRLIAKLQRAVGEEWLIVFTADHGESLGEHEYYFDHGAYAYTPSLRVPLLFVHLGGESVVPVGIYDEWVSLVDVAPTIVELLALETTAAWRAQVEGRPLLPRRDGDPGSRPIFAESGKAFHPDLIRRRVRFDLGGRFRTVIDGGWKLVWTPGAPVEEAYELYDLKADPYELEDLYAPDHPKARALVNHLDAWMRDPATEAKPPSAADLERLRSLGYVD